MKTAKISYRDEKTVLEGYYAYDAKIKGKRPVIIVVHDWSGKNEFACKKADKLAELGYVGFAIDMFGEGKTGSTKEEKQELIKPFVNDRDKLKERILTAYETAKTLDNADDSRIGAIGFCFGGLCALDLARSGADVKGVVSFHGLLNSPGKDTPYIRARILALHGYDDPMGKPDQVIAFADEMTKAKADWELCMYGNTMHAFTNPNANDPGFGTVYNKNADHRSWIAMTEFFRQVF